MTGSAFLSSWSISRKFLLLLPIILLPISGIVVTSSISHRADEIRMAEKDALLLVQGLAAQQEQLTAATKQMLSILARLPAVRNLDASACDKLFSEVKENDPICSFIGVTTPDGNLVADSAPFFPGAVNLSGRKNVKDAISTLDFSVGEYIVGKVTKVPSINFSYPVQDVNKAILAILIAALGLDEYAQFLTKVNLPRDSVCTVTDHKGRRLFRFPETGSVPLGALVDEDTLRRISGDREQGVFERTAQDGIHRIYAFKRLRLREDCPPYLYISVGIAKSRIVERANLNMLRGLAGLGLSGLFGVLFVWMTAKRLLIRPINQLVETTRQFGEGKIEARTGLPHTPDELGRLAESFDKMGSLLEISSIERMRAEVKIRTAELQRANKILLMEISERRKVEGALFAALIRAEDEKSRSESIIAGVSDGLTIVDKDLKVIYQNEISRTHGGSHLGENCYRGIHGRDQICEDCAVAGCFADGFVHRKESRRVVEGKIHYVEVATSPLRNAAGEITGAIQIGRDISEHKRTEKALAESRQLLANIIDFLPDATFVINRKGRVIAWNLAMEEMTGTGAADVLGKGDYEYALHIYGERRPVLIDSALDPAREVGANYFNVRRKGGVLYGESYISEWRGRAAYLFETASVLYDPGGNAVGAIESIRDITERRLLEEGLKGHLHRLRVQNGLAGSYDHENLELLLTYAMPAKDVKRIARDLLSEFGNNLASIFDSPVEVLQRVEGIEEHAAVLIRLIPRLFDSYLSSLWVRHETFDSTEAAASYIRALLGTQRNEVFCVLALDSRNRLIAVERVQEGSVNRTAIFPRQVVEISLKHHATAVVLGHNHPGGSLLPSAADRQITQRLRKILGDLDIVLHDHIIISGYDQYYSFAETGCLDESLTLNFPYGW